MGHARTDCRLNPDREEGAFGTKGSGLSLKLILKEQSPDL